MDSQQMNLALSLFGDRPRGINKRRCVAHILLLASFLVPGAVLKSVGEEPQHPVLSQVDSDNDGISDDVEQALLAQFVPTFLIGQDDCSNVPAEFRAGSTNPEVQSENGTIYGQVFPIKTASPNSLAAEIHYYHLWRVDCGGHGHPLDTEHVSVVVRCLIINASALKWKAVYWYAAAHENTVCDVSQIARASTLHAEDKGANIWISPGKHASYLNEAMCQKGCGADRCERMRLLVPERIINLGELGHPMNSSVFISSDAWPLASKMEGTNFPPAALARLDELPDSDIAWFNPGRHPSQGIIAISSTTEQGIAVGGHGATAGISSAAGSTGDAIAVAEGASGNALQKSSRHTLHALASSARHVGKALHLGKSPERSKYVHQESSEK